MKQQFKNYFKYIIIVIFIIFIIFLYENKVNNAATISKNNKTSADYLLNDPSQQQHHFQNSTTMKQPQLNNFNSSCNCSSLLKTNDIFFVEHGEELPLFVPDSLSPIQPDILDKMNANKYDDHGLIVTVANYDMRMELYNWIQLLEKAEERKFVVFCIDEKLYLHLMVAGYEDKAVLVPQSWILSDSDLVNNNNNNTLTDDEHSLLGQNSSIQLSLVKIRILQRLVYADPHFNILMLDVNQIMIRKRTREYIQALLHIREDTQMIATQDNMNQSPISTGLLMVRGTHNEILKRVLARSIQIQEIEREKINQQEAFIRALDQFSLNVKTGMMVLLDMLHFPNGNIYFEKKLYKSKHMKPYIIHVNHKV
ncbi:uncharacterized protein BX663DRAFT_505519 [Cokeromyces recurvatus]|uniref:uncharacterized protein n=1 Tax=Cokeromyces recurvatus TaxID=90255 RepID=UPI00222103E1|nr:uncharacterized protein BX663DRAFT_505519 [Cokeromyces recurvatus]KAI7903871.1 hypothetical protein BX663DRAFT_505519 [Cokeromyces recurvatus]